MHHTHDKMNPLHGETPRTDIPRSDGHAWQGQRSDGSMIGPFNEQASVDDLARRAAARTAKGGEA